MKTILLLLFTNILFSQVDTTLPVKIKLNDKELICFSTEQAGKVFLNYQRLVDCMAKAAVKDSTITSLKVENSKFSELNLNNQIIINALGEKIGHYQSIVAEKEKQLVLAEREGMVKSLKASNNNTALMVFVFLAGGLLGFAIGN